MPFTILILLFITILILSTLFNLTSTPTLDTQYRKSIPYPIHTVPKLIPSNLQPPYPNLDPAPFRSHQNDTQRDTERDIPQFRLDPRMIYYDSPSLTQRLAPPITSPILLHQFQITNILHHLIPKAHISTDPHHYFHPLCALQQLLVLHLQALCRTVLKWQLCPCCHFFSLCLPNAFLMLMTADILGCHSCNR